MIFSSVRSILHILPPAYSPMHSKTLQHRNINSDATQKEIILPTPADERRPLKEEVLD